MAAPRRPAPQSGNKRAEIAALSTSLQAAPPPAEGPTVKQEQPAKAPRGRKTRKRWSGETKHLQVRVPKSLHNRYKRLQDEAFNQGKEVSQRSWLVALLAEGPRSPSQLRDMVERCSAQAQKEHGGPDSVVGALVPTELTRQYRSWINNLEIDEDFTTSMVEVVVCLMHEGPQTSSQLLGLTGQLELAA